MRGLAQRRLPAQRALQPATEALLDASRRPAGLVLRLRQHAAAAVAREARAQVAELRAGVRGEPVTPKTLLIVEWLGRYRSDQMDS